MSSGVEGAEASGGIVTFRPVDRPPGVVSWGRVYRRRYRRLSQFNGSRGTVRTVLGLSGGT